MAENGNTSSAAEMAKKLEKAAEAANKLERAVRAVNQNTNKLAQVERMANRLEKAFDAVGTAGQKMANHHTDQLSRMENGYKRLGKAVEEVNHNTQKLDPGAAFNKAIPQIQNAAKAFNQFQCEQTDLNKGFGTIEKLMDGFAGKVKKMAGLSLDKVLSLSDRDAASLEKLSLINDGSQTADALQRKVMDVANNSRLSYDMTANGAVMMGQTKAFSSNDEMLRFLELVNKQFAISATAASDMPSAFEAISGALREGVLSADAFDTILKTVPTIAETLAGSLGVPVEKLKEMAAEGAISAQALQNAMFSAANAVNNDFAEIPATWEQVKNLMGNSMLTTFGPLLQGISQVAQWVAENWSSIEPVLWGVAGAAAAVVAVMGVWKAVTLLQTIAQMGLNAALLASGIGAIIIGVGLVVYAIARWVQSVGGVHVAWLICCNAVMTIWDAVKISFLTGFYQLLNLFDLSVTRLKIWKLSMLNGLGGFKASALMLLQNLVNGAIDTINFFISALNKIPGVSIDLISQVTFGTEAQLQNEAEKQARAVEMQQEMAAYQQKVQERSDKIAGMRQQANMDAASRQREIEAARSEADRKKAEQNASYLPSPGQDNIYGEGLTGVGVQGIGQGGYVPEVGSVGEVGSVRNDVNIADEDIQLMKDVAEMRYVQNFVTLTPTVAMDAKISEKVDKEEVLGDIERTLVCQIAAAAEGIFA